MFETHTFPCPNCNEIINDSMRECRFCRAPIDPQAARAAGELQARVNQACSDASYTATAAYLMFAFLLLDLIPFVPFVWLAYVLTFFAVIFLIVRWQVRFGGLRTRDPDYKRALFSRNVALVLWLVAMPVWIVGHIFGAVIIAVLFR
ncbi:MAG: hypothetical protein JOZ02_18270 [Acidobacteria bacterium]|nr:hypothetical protein [Acidobacteriota bacterium]